MRISGINSGLDIDKIVSDLMKAEKIPQDKLKQKKTTISWQTDAYREINTKLSSLKTTLDTIKLSGDWKSNKATVSNQSAVSVSAGTTAANLSHSIEISKLATASSSYSSSAISTSSIDASTATLGSLGITGTSFKINGAEINYEATDTLASLMSKVNNSNAGVNMSFDDEGKRVVLTSKSSGAASAIDIEEGTGSNLLDRLKLSSSAKVAGADAEFILDGVSYTRSNNKFTLDGVTYTLQQATTAPVTVSVQQDVDSMLDKIKSFVTKYNETIELMNKRVKETKYRDFTPLTDDQKKDMEEKEITTWEEKAKSGVLRNDDILKSTLSGLRSLVSAKVGSASSDDYDAFYKVGITTLAYSASATQDSGKLQIDEAKLKEALNTDPSKVIELFSNNPDGIAQQMYTQIDKSLTQLVDKAGKVGAATDLVTNTLGDQISKLNKKITDMTSRLADKEKYYYKMFAAMDTAVGNSNSTLSWLSSQMG